jgi:dethiobiotin synthetase
MHKGIFITGTDTGVGKTFVAAGILGALKNQLQNQKREAYSCRHFKVD